MQALCCVCERAVVTNPCKDDPDFCQSCFDEVEEMTNNPMLHVRAARAFLETRPHDKKLHMFAFLSIFHPTMPVRRRHELANLVE